MAEQQLKIKVTNQNNEKIIEFDRRLADLSPYIKNQPYEVDTITIDVPIEHLENFKKLLEVNDYDKSKFRVKKPIKSCIPKDNIDENSWTVLQNYQVALDEEGIPKETDIEKWEHLIKIAFEWEIDEIRDVILAVFASIQYMGFTETEIQQFCDRFHIDINQDITPEMWEEARNNKEVMELYEPFERKDKAEVVKQLEALAAQHGNG